MLSIDYINSIIKQIVIYSYTYLAARFAAVLSFSDKLGLKEQGAPKQLSGPIQAKTTYASLP